MNSDLMSPQFQDYIEKARETASFVRENLYESGNKTLLRSIYTSKSDAENVEQGRNCRFFENVSIVSSLFSVNDIPFWRCIACSN